MPNLLENNCKQCGQEIYEPSQGIKYFASEYCCPRCHDEILITWAESSFKKSLPFQQFLAKVLNIETCDAEFI